MTFDETDDFSTYPEILDIPERIKGGNKAVYEMDNLRFGRYVVFKKTPVKEQIFEATEIEVMALKKTN